MNTVNTLCSIDEYKDDDNVWNYVLRLPVCGAKIDNDNEPSYFVLHPSLQRLSMTIALKLLTEAPMQYVNHNFPRYKAYQQVGFYLFMTTTLGDFSPRCDPYGKWKNGTTQIDSTDSMRVTYFYHAKHEKFRKVEYRLNYTIDSVYRGLLLYYRPDDVSHEPPPPERHGNAKNSNVVEYKRTISSQYQKMKDNFALSQKGPHEIVRENIGKSLQPRNAKQVDNIQYNYRKQAYTEENLTRSLLMHSDLVKQAVDDSINRTIALGANDAIEMLKQHRVWYTDTTFNMSNSFATAVVFKNKDFEKGAQQCAFIYLHVVSLDSIYTNMLESKGNYTLFSFISSEKSSWD
jgi:hypothetical protein